MTNKRKTSDELRDLSDAIDESILGASDAVVSEELVGLGLDPEKVAVEMDVIAQKAKRAAAESRLARAKDAVIAYRNSRADVSRIDRTALRSKLHRMRLGGPRDDDGLMMAARKGKQMSQADEEGALDDLAQLEALESEDPESSKE